MPDIDQFKSQLFQLPLEHQEEIADELCGNIATEYARQAAEDEARHLAIVRSRRAEIGSPDEVPMTTLPDAIGQTFGTS